MTTASERATRPTCEQLLAAPELASLALLETALEIVAVALGAAWPELHDLELCQTGEPRAALEILERASELLAALHRYRVALAVARDARDDLPF